MKLELIAAGAAMGYLAWRYFDQVDQAAADQAGAFDQVGGVLSSATESTAQLIDRNTGGLLKLSSMSRVTADDLAHPNVRAMLRVIRQGEGTSDAGGYSRLFGGGTFANYADHPRRAVTKSGYTSTAAGAYQFLSSTWDETAGIMGLRDFSPANQDLAAVGRIAARGALELVKAGRFDAAVRAMNREWASLPESPYGQRTTRWDVARNTFASSGGTINNQA